MNKYIRLIINYIITKTNKCLSQTFTVCFNLHVQNNVYYIYNLL